MAEFNDNIIPTDEEQKPKKESLEEILARIDKTYKGYRVDEYNNKEKNKAIVRSSAMQSKSARLFDKNKPSDFDFARELSSIKAELSSLGAIRLEMKSLESIQAVLADLPVIKSELESVTAVKSDFKSIDEIRSRLCELTVIRDSIEQIKEGLNASDDLKEAIFYLPVLKAEIAKLKVILNDVLRKEPDFSALEEIKDILIELPAIRIELASLKSEIKKIKLDSSDLIVIEEIISILSRLPEIKEIARILELELSRLHDIYSNIKSFSEVQTKLVDGLDEIRSNFGSLNSLSEQIAGLVTRADASSSFGEIKTSVEHRLESIDARVAEMDSKYRLIDDKVSELIFKIDKSLSTVEKGAVEEAVSGRLLDIINKKTSEINTNLEKAIGTISSRVDHLAVQIQTMVSQKAKPEAKPEGDCGKLATVDGNIHEIVNKPQPVEEKVAREPEVEKVEIRAVRGELKSKVPVVVESYEFTKEKTSITAVEDAEILSEPKAKGSI